MKRVILLLILVVVGTLFLGGSAFWQVTGLGNSLTVNGEARVVLKNREAALPAWTAYGGDPGGNRHSTARQITPDNVTGLEIAWVHNSGSLNDRPENALRRVALETTPIFIDNLLIYCAQFNEVIALDPATGAEQWRFDPVVDTERRPANQYTCRGVSHWRDADADPQAHCSSRIITGTVDSRLIALDARNGELCTGFGDGGTLQLTPSTDLRWPGEMQITSAPAILRDTIITGSSIGDNLRTNAPKGTVQAFNIRTGEQKWSFNPVPQDVETAEKMGWEWEQAQNTGHANVWSTISVDEKRGWVFLPTSSPAPDYYGGNRLGDNRYANSVVALDGETGEVIWHFQTVHHDVWDHDVPAQPGLYSVYKNGTLHDVVAQVTKAGHVFVLVRDTGEPFLPIEELPVPTDGVNGEALSPTQPFPIDPPAIVPSSLEPEDAFGITLLDKRACAKKIEGLRRDSLYAPPTLEGTLTYPFTGGGANWGSAAYDPSRNLLVVNMSNAAAYLRLTEKTGGELRQDTIEDGAEQAPMEGAPYTMERSLLLSPLGLPCSPPPWGVIAGVDLAKGEIVWRKTLGTTEDIAPGGLKLKFGTPNLGGPITTASGLTFIGAAMDDYLRAFDTATGEELWKGRLPAGGQATPMSYVYNGRQYVVIAAGGHARAGTKTGDNIVAFALPE